MGVGMNVLITGSGGPAGINALRFLPPHIQRIACDADENAKQRMEEAGVANIKFYNVPPANHPEFLKALKKILKKENIDMVIPTVDEELLILAEKQKEMGAKVIISPYETIRTCNDKFLLYEVFKGFDFCPKYLVTESREDLLDFFGRDKVLVKPRISRGSRGVYVFETPEAVPGELITEKNIFCEYLPGREYTVDALCDLEGNLVLAIPRLRVKTEKGVSIHGKTERNNEILRCVEKTCNTLKFIGPINIQFKYDSKEKPKLVEINPRLSGGFPITVASGLNPLEILFRMIEGERIDKETLVWFEKEFKHQRV
mgnify:CR=1 FL=1